jgi:hypothetical protein
MKKYKNRFVYSESPGFGKRLELFHNPNIYLYDKLKESKEFYLEEGMNGLIFDNTIYYPFNNLDILQEFPEITTVEVTTSNITNFDGLKYAPKLENIKFETSAKLNLEIVPNTVTNLILAYHKKITGLKEMDNLKYLAIYKDNNDLDLPKNLEHLVLIQSKRDSLKFTDDLKNLKELELYHCNKMTSIDEMANWITKLKIDDCKYLDRV